MGSRREREVEVIIMRDGGKAEEVEGRGAPRGEGEVRGVKCHIYTCMGGEEVGGGGHGSRLALCCDRTVLPQKNQ